MSAEKAARKCLGLDRGVFVAGGSLRAHRELTQMAAVAFASRSENWVAQRALAGDKSAWQACLEAAAHEISEGHALSGDLAKFIVQFLKAAAKQPKVGRGPDPNANRERDFRIALAVFSACQEGGVHPTRNDAAMDEPSSTESGCSIVAKLLRNEFDVDLSERAVSKIWRQHKHLR